MSWSTSALAAAAGAALLAGLATTPLVTPADQPVRTRAPAAVVDDVSAGGRPTSAGGPVSDGWAVLPVPGARLLRPFEAPSVRWGPGHRGVDIAAGVDAVVVAPTDGVVAFVGTVVDRPVVTVRHTDGLLSSVEPVVGSVPVGTAVGRGEAVGRVGTGGHCVGCVHWGVRRGESYIDPLRLLAAGPPVRLLPGARQGPDASDPTSATHLPPPDGPGAPPGPGDTGDAWDRSAALAVLQGRPQA